MIKSKALVTVQWLNEHLLDEDIIILDASLRKNKTGNSVPYLKKGIPNTRYFNISEKFSDLNSPFPNMLPAFDVLETDIQKLGITSDSMVVIYDQNGMYSSPRAWWMFKLLGFDNVYVLDGGFPAWKEEGFQITPILHNNFKRGNFKINPNSSLLINYTQMKDNLQSKEYIIVDARSQERFLGNSPEPRPLTKSGHYPGSINIHYNTIVRNGHLKPKEEISNIFNIKEIKNRSLVFSCGSGITACILYLAAYMYLDNPIAVYDGSWTEWGEREI